MFLVIITQAICITKKGRVDILFVFGRVLERARWTVAARHPEMMDTGNTEHPRPGRHDTRQCASKSGDRPYHQSEAVWESRRLRHKATDKATGQLSVFRACSRFSLYTVLSGLTKVFILQSLFQYFLAFHKKYLKELILMLSTVSFITQRKIFHHFIFLL